MTTRYVQSSPAQSSPAVLPAEAARTWIARWDAQQEGFLPDREERFTALIDVVAETAGRPDPLVIDLGCGPGSLAVRLLDAIPEASVVAVDADPLLLALGSAAWGGRAQLRFADVDLRVPGWSERLGLPRPADAAVSTTALHWLGGPELVAVYAELAAALRPGGILLNGDNLHEDETAPTLAAVGRAMVERELRRRYPGGPSETWEGWWDAVLAEPALAGPAAERASRNYGSHHGSPSRYLRVHAEALHAAGFAEVGTLWQRGSNRLLCAVLPDGPRESAGPAGPAGG